MKAREVMTSDPAIVMADAPISEAADMMRTRGASLLPVVDDRDSRHLQGVITDRDILERCVAAGHAGRCHVRDHMSTSPLESVSLDDDVTSVVGRMKAAHVQRLPVVDGGRVAGIISRADLVTRASFNERAAR